MSSQTMIPVDRVNAHCATIYENLVKSVPHPCIQDDANREALMAQFRQQIDFLYARRYGKKRIG